MSTPAETGPAPLRPVGGHERIEAIDITRGIALFGVLMMNLLIDFRVPLAQHILQFHTHPGPLNHFVDWLFELVVAGKAITAFSFLFGVGLAIQADRAEQRKRGALAFLARRLLVLLGFGLVHMFVIWNGDILSLYAVAGLLGLLFVRRSTRVLWIAIGVVSVLSSLPFGSGNPVTGSDAAKTIAESLRAYGSGGYPEILVFRAHEAVHSMIPLYLILLPRTLGLFLLGVVAFRRGVFQRPSEHRALLRWTVAVCGPVGIAATIVMALVSASVISLGRFTNPVASFTMVPLALAYLACLLMLLSRPTFPRWLSRFAPLGRMALTNYLLQSVVLGFVFYGYGLGLFGKVGPAAAAPIGFVLYGAQLAFSAAWLRRYRFGPIEWLWRSLTYGERQPMRR